MLRSLENRVRLHQQAIHSVRRTIGNFAGTDHLKRGRCFAVAVWRNGFDLISARHTRLRKIHGEITARVQLRRERNGGASWRRHSDDHHPVPVVAHTTAGNLKRPVQRHQTSPDVGSGSGSVAALSPAPALALAARIRLRVTPGKKERLSLTLVNPSRLRSRLWESSDSSLAASVRNAPGAAHLPFGRSL